MGRKGDSVSLSINSRQKEALEQLALEYGMMWGDRPNISRLMQAIAKRKLLIAPNHDWSVKKIAALDQIRNILIDIGELDEARLIAQILCDRSEIEDPLRRKLENFLDTELLPWRQSMNVFIKRQQPFKLVYQDASDRLFQFTVLYARVELIEKRYYLLCRCEETEGNSDVEELKHNWSLRLDRIKQAEVIKLDRQWQANLQQIEVEFNLFGGLAFGYEQRSEDVSVGDVEGEAASRKVVRKVESTFWFFRDIVRYGGRCKIVSPENIRSKFFEEIVLKLGQVYKC